MNLFRILHRMAWGMAHKRMLSGVAVGVFMASEGREDALAKVGQALALLQELSPRRFARLRRDVGRVLVFGTGAAPALWHEALGTCELNRRSVADPDVSPAVIACLLAHEAMHARLCRLGFTYGEHERVRVERACYRAQRAFARRLPEPERGRLVSWAEEGLAALEHWPGHWGDAARLSADLESFRRQGVPPWLLRVMERLTGWRLARAERQRQRQVER